MTAEEKKIAAKQERFETLKGATDIINFKNATLIKRNGLYVRMDDATFSKAAYDTFGALAKSTISDLEHMVRVLAEDRTELAHLISFGDKVWDTKKLNWTAYDANKTVFASRIEPNQRTEAPLKYLIELAKGDEELAWDMLQGLAPIFMDKKPAGVVWFVGDGANGKSSLLNAMYRIIGHHFGSMTVNAIEDGRDTPRLNGLLANVCRESSEGRVEDSEKYKALGTHEPFEVHKFNSQDGVIIDGNLHHVFNANNIPTFADKTQGSRRRTLIIPFRNTFADNPTFEDDTFTDEFLGGLLTLVLEATHVIRDNRFKYRFSEATEMAKADYDASVNSVEGFFNHLMEKKVEGFDDYLQLRHAYEAWCDREGVVALGKDNIKKSINALGDVQRKSVRTEIDGKIHIAKRYFFGHSLTTVGLERLTNGLYVRPMTAKAEEETPPAAPPPVQGELGSDW